MKSNRRTILKGVGAGLGAIIVMGTGSFYYSVLNQSKHRHLVIGGSTTVKRFIQKLVEGFELKNKGVDLLIDGGRSYAGLVALEQGGIDIAMMSHGLTSAENNTSVHNYLIGIEAVALVVNDKCPINSISFENARKVLERKIVNWKELGGTDAPINLFSRADGSTTKVSIEEILLDGATIDERAKELSSSKDMAEEIALEPLSFGFLSARDFVPGVKALRIDDVEMNNKNIYLRVYPLIRELYLVIKDDSSEIAKSFLAYVLSEQGQHLLANSGVVRVK